MWLSWTSGTRSRAPTRWMANKRWAVMQTWGETWRQESSWHTVRRKLTSKWSRLQQLGQRLQEDKPSGGMALHSLEGTFKGIEILWLPNFALLRPASSNSLSLTIPYRLVRENGSRLPANSSAKRTEGRHTTAVPRFVAGRSPARYCDVHEARRCRNNKSWTARLKRRKLVWCSDISRTTLGEAAKVAILMPLHLRI